MNNIIIQKESWAKLAPRPEKRKHFTGARSKEDGGAKRPATGSTVSSGPIKPIPMSKFTFVLVEKPKMVDEGHARFWKDDLPAIVADGYSSPPAIVEGKASMFNFVLLSKKPVSRGAHPFLIPHKTAGEFDLQDLEWSIQTHRQEKAYKRCIFISLSRWSPDLKLDIDDESEADLSELSDDDTHPFVFKRAFTEKAGQCHLMSVPL
ncbi:hypothetical protein B0H14DRAFT_3432818 [Mycena olivaceomarginata]|nr:hypothetical protein B0H14DRAFT_3432818 [Mycena olivaceomarginata]